MGIAREADQRYPCPDKHLSVLFHYASLVFINYRLIMLASGNCQISSDRHKPSGFTQQKNICESWIDPQRSQSNFLSSFYPCQQIVCSSTLRFERILKSMQITDRKKLVASISTIPKLFCWLKGPRAGGQKSQRSGNLSCCFSELVLGVIFQLRKSRFGKFFLTYL